VNQAVALIVNIYQNSPINNSPINNSPNQRTTGKQSAYKESIKNSNNNEEEKLLGEISNIFSEKKKKIQEHEVINRELLIPHKYLLTIPKSQKILYKQFQATLKEKYQMIGKISLYLLVLIYLIQTLIMTNAKIYEDYLILIYFLRGSFNFFILVTAIIFSQNNWKETYMYLILAIFALGIITNAVESSYSLYRDLHVVKLVEFMLIYIIYINLQ